MRKTLLPLLAVLLLVVGGALFFLLPDLGGPPSFNGTVLPDPQPAPPVELATAAGEPVALRDFQGEVVLLYFGYAYCPDICPTTMVDLARVQRDVDDDGGQVQVIMITVDPERDTPQLVGEYAAGFHPDFIGLSGTLTETAAIADSWGVYYEKQEGTAATGYLVDHTARVFLVDKAGRYRLTYPFGTEPEAIISDVETLLKEDAPLGRE